MNRAQEITNLVNETLTAPMPAITDLKGNEEVLFKPNTMCAGRAGIIAGIHVDLNSVDVVVAGTIQVDVSLDDLLILSNSSNMAPDKTAPVAPEAPAAE